VSRIYRQGFQCSKRIVIRIRIGPAQANNWRERTSSRKAAGLATAKGRHNLRVAGPAGFRIVRWNEADCRRPRLMIGCLNHRCGLDFQPPQSLSLMLFFAMRTPCSDECGKDPVRLWRPIRQITVGTEGGETSSCQVFNLENEVHSPPD